MNAIALHFQNHWRRYVRWLLWALAVLCLLFLLAWAILAWYIRTHKQELLQKLTTSLSEQTGGTVAVKDLSLTLWEDFPHMAISLTDVSLHDSLYSRHGIDLANIHQLFLRTGVVGLVTRKINVRKFILKGGSIHLFTDSTGYSNKYLLQSRDTTKKKRRDVFVKAFLLQDIDLTISDVPKNKNYALHINALEGRGRKRGQLLHYRLQTDLFIGGLGFNLAAGEYLENAVVSGPMQVDVDQDKKEALVHSKELNIGNVPLTIAARFNFKSRPAVYEIHLSGKAIPFEQAKKWITKKIRSKLELVSLENPIAMTCDLSGLMKFRDTPIVHVTWQVKNNILSTEYGDFTAANFSGDFTNQLKQGGWHNDPNSGVRILQFTGKISGIPLEIDTLQVENLIYPLVTLRVRSSFSATQANEIGGPDFPFRFTGGTAAADIRYRGGVRSDDTLYPQLNGYARIRDVAFVYVPRGISVTGVNSLLLLQGDDLYLRDVNISTHAGSVQMEGSALHFFRFYFTQPGKVALRWRGASNYIDLSMLNAFIGRPKFLSNGNRAPARRRTNKLAVAAAQLNRVLDECTADLGVNFKQLKYRQFTAGNVKAKVLLTADAITVPELSLNHAGGSIDAKAQVAQQGARNPFTISAQLRQVGVSALFKAFENFGQDAITSENLNGRLTAGVNATGIMSAGGRVQPKSVNGTVRFTLENGRLYQFGPFLKIAKFAFKKRGLDDVHFEKLEDMLEYRNGKIIIPPLHIQSSAFNMLVQGVYAPPNGTNIAITLPLGNPSGSSRWKRKGKVGPGIVLNLIARDGEDGNVKIGWDASKRGKKQAAEMFDADSTGQGPR